MDLPNCLTSASEKNDHNVPRVVSQWSDNDVQWSLTSQWPYNGLWSLSAPAFLCLRSFFACRLHNSSCSVREKI